MAELNEEEDYIAAGDKIKELIDEHGSIPEIIYVSDIEELQSYMMWWCMTSGLKYKRHPSRSYCEGSKE
jgi:hypothetical protein